eukprot:1340894-Prymnesium_polylepis.1
MRHMRGQTAIQGDVACGGGRGDAASAPRCGDEAAGGVPHGLAATLRAPLSAMLTLAPRLPHEPIRLHGGHCAALRSASHESIMAGASDLPLN